MLLALYIANFSTSLFNITETVAWEQTISVVSYHALNQVSKKSININIEKVNVLGVLD